MAAQNSLSHENWYSIEQDVESSPVKPAVESKEELKQKRLKYLAYIVVFIVFQTGIITLFSLTVMKIRTPKFRIESATFETFNIGTAANPSFDMKMNARLGIKNTNFGGFKYEDTILIFYYNDTPIPVGEASVSESKVGWRTTKKMNVLVSISSNSLPTNSTQLGSDLDYGFLTFYSRAELNGKVKLFGFLFRKKKTVDLDCYVTVYLAGKVVHEVSCH